MGPGNVNIRNWYAQGLYCLLTKLVTLALSIPIIWLLLAVSLSALPVHRSKPDKTLNFDSLQEHTFTVAEGIETDFAARDGSSLFYREYRGHDELILVLLHGSGSEGRYLREMASRLEADMGITVILPDLRGHGRSANDLPGDIQYLGQLEDDLYDLLSELRERNPGSLIVLGGHSSGGGLAVRFGGSTRKQFDGYLLISPYLGHDSPVVRPSSGGWVQVSKRRYAGLAMLNSIGYTGLNHLPVLFFNRPESMSDELQVDSYSFRLNESISPRDHATDLENISAPVLVLAGNDDEALYADRFEAVLAAHLDSAELAIVPGAGHLDIVENPQAIQLTAEWLKVLPDLIKAPTISPK